MKKLVLLGIVMGAAYIGWNHLQGRRQTVALEQAVQDVERDLRDAEATVARLQEQSKAAGRKAREQIDRQLAEAKALSGRSRQRLDELKRSAAAAKEKSGPILASLRSLAVRIKSWF